MFVPFSQLPDSARVWIFQADRPFTPEDTRKISDTLRSFTDEWSVHGVPMNTSFQILHGYFIVLAADESHHAASGCSIDSSVRVLKQIEQECKVNLFDRNNIAFRLGNEVVLFTMQELKEKFANGVLTEASLTFNNLVSSNADLASRWIVPAGETWLKRYLPKSLENA